MPGQAEAFLDEGCSAVEQCSRMQDRRLLGPVPMFMGGSAGKYRARTLLQRRMSRAPLHRLATPWAAEPQQHGGRHGCTVASISIRSTCSERSRKTPCRLGSAGIRDVRRKLLGQSPQRLATPVPAHGYAVLSLDWPPRAHRGENSERRRPAGSFLSVIVARRPSARQERENDEEHHLPADPVAPDQLDRGRHLPAGLTLAIQVENTKDLGHG